MRRSLSTRLCMVIIVPLKFLIPVVVYLLGPLKILRKNAPARLVVYRFVIYRDKAIKFGNVVYSQGQNAHKPCKFGQNYSRELLLGVILRKFFKFSRFIDWLVWWNCETAWIFTAWCQRVTDSAFAACSRRVLAARHRHDHRTSTVAQRQSMYSHVITYADGSRAWV